MDCCGPPQEVLLLASAVTCNSMGSPLLRKRDRGSRKLMIEGGSSGGDGLMRIEPTPPGVTEVRIMGAATAAGPLVLRNQGPNSPRTQLGSNNNPYHNSSTQKVQKILNTLDTSLRTPLPRVDAVDKCLPSCPTHAFHPHLSHASGGAYRPGVCCQCHRRGVPDRVYTGIGAGAPYLDEDPDCYVSHGLGIRVCFWCGLLSDVFCLCSVVWHWDLRTVDSLNVL